MPAPSDTVIEDDIDRLLSLDLPWDALFGLNILVTGASGMIPSFVVRTLLGLNDRMQAGIKVLGLVRNGSKARSLLGSLIERRDFELLVSDVAEFRDFDGPLDVVIHGASAAQPKLHAVDPVSTIRANLLGSFNLLDLCVAKNCGRFVLMSSSEIYGNQDPSLHLISESSYGGLDTLHPRSCYAEGKRGAESIVSSYSHQYGIQAKILRFGHIYGPGMAFDDGRVQAEFAAQVLRGNDIVLNSDGSAVRTYTYLVDAVAGLFYALLIGDDMAYNVADPEGLLSIRDLAQLFINARPEKNLKLVFSDPAHADRSMYNAMPLLGLDSRKLASLGWRPRTAIVDGLDRMLRSLESAPPFAGPLL